MAIAAEVSVYCRAMDYCHRHNLVDPTLVGAERRFGIRVTLPEGDTMRKILGEDWETLHWYPSEAERDSAFEQMAVRHGYYRNTDSPTQVLEKIIR
ncbi:MAG: hypothetical protein OEM85_11325 [Gammaproteobacteria bacterium]|nr:hypothetical protein [Gammaproteobacteria bacterium]MDH3409678.1 hypothetical protein [Gammaproteobacteria bacterium]